MTSSNRLIAQAAPADPRPYLKECQVAARWVARTIRPAALNYGYADHEVDDFECEAIKYLLGVMRDVARGGDDLWTIGGEDLAIMVGHRFGLGMSEIVDDMVDRVVIRKNQVVGRDRT